MSRDTAYETHVVFHIWRISMVIITFVTISPIIIVESFSYRFIVAMVVVPALISVISTISNVTIMLVPVIILEMISSVILTIVTYSLVIWNILRYISSLETLWLKFCQFRKMPIICWWGLLFSMLCQLTDLILELSWFNLSGPIPVLQKCLWNVLGFNLLFVSVLCYVSSVLSVMCASIYVLSFKQLQLYFGGWFLEMF